MTGEATWRGVPLRAGAFISHAIHDDAQIAKSVRLTMSGEIKIGTWHAFRAEQVIVNNGDFIWSASTSLYGLPVRGSDRLVQGKGSMRWKLFGLIPIISADGIDISRSGIGRVQGELVAWLPSALLRHEISWDDRDGLSVRLPLHGENTEIQIETNSSGGLAALHYPRWGNPGGGAFGYSQFGVIVEAERNFGQHTIPSEVRAGWYFGSPRFESEGEFFRATVESADYQ